METNGSGSSWTLEEEEEEGEGGSALDLVNEVTYRFLVPILISAGIVTNLLNVAILRRVGCQQKRQQATGTTFFYLLWLATTDLLASASLVPSVLHLDRNRLSYAWAFYYAHLEIPLQNALTSASVYIVVGLSVDRYVAVCHPRRYREVSTPGLASVRVALSLSVPLVLYTPHGFSQEALPVLEEGGDGPLLPPAYTYGASEMAEPGLWYVWTVVVELCHRMAPATILVALNFRIIFSFRRMTAARRRLGGKSQRGAAAAASSRVSNASRRSDDSVRSQQEQRLVYLLLAIVAAFLLTTLPAAVLALIDTEGATHGSFSHEVFRAVANSLEVLGFSLNFLLYFIFVPDVRRELRRATCASSAEPA